METALPSKTYKTPPRKLARFFEKSRNRWKDKYREAKRTVKRLKNRVRFLEKSKASARSQVKELKAELVRMHTRHQALEKQVATLKQMAARSALPATSGSEDLALVPFHHHYSVGLVNLFVSMVLSAAASLRCAGQVMQIVLSTFQLPWTAPSWSAGRLWLLRLGYYKLTRSKEQANDWVWIVDYTLQLGCEKCLVILGVRLSALPSPDRCLGHADVEPLTLCPLQHSNGAIVYQRLEETAVKTGIPREIISDAGTDVHSGIERFCQVHSETCAIYDIKHKTAAVLKRELEQDAVWQEFTQLAAQTKHHVQQTPLAALAPPNQKAKARYMNFDLLVRWGQRLRVFLERPLPESPFDPEQLQEKLGWIMRFREPLQEWSVLLQIVTTSESFVRHHGVYRGVERDLHKELPELEIETERTRRVRQQLLAFVAAEERKVAPDERLLGSSEVIESAFGKLKRLERDQAKNGFTGLVLGMAALVSVTTSEVIHKALATVPTKEVLAWCKENLGQSIQVINKELFAACHTAEQKRDQLAQPA
jgi:hypothetical protein